MKKKLLIIAVGLTIFSIAKAQLNVTSTGTVGIGTASPHGKLDIIGGGLEVRGTSGDPGGSAVTVSQESGYARLQSWNGQPLVLNPVGNNVAIGATDPGSAKLYVNGNVGIGTTNPAYNLDVAGSLRTGTINTGTTTTGRTLWQGWTSVLLDWMPPYNVPTMYPTSDGNFVIGAANSRVYMQAIQVWATWFTTTSDERVKENIVSLQSSLQKIKRLRAVQYNIKKEYVSDIAMKSKSDLRKSNIGFIAQDVQKIFPDLVTQSDSVGLYGINYMEFIPIIIDAMKEQSKTIDSLKAQTSAMDSLKAQLAVLTNQVGVLQNCCSSNKGGGKTKSELVNDAETVNQSTSNTTSQTSAAKLYQNAPNPFKESTTIKLEIPETVGNAMVCIYDLNGRQLKCLAVSGRGITSVQIFGNELTAGLYHYALIADGALIDTKTMVLTN